MGLAHLDQRAVKVSYPILSPEQSVTRAAAFWGDYGGDMWRLINSKISSALERYSNVNGGIFVKSHNLWLQNSFIRQ